MYSNNLRKLEYYECTFNIRKYKQFYLKFHSGISNHKSIMLVMDETKIPMKYPYTPKFEYKFQDVRYASCIIYVSIHSTFPRELFSTWKEDTEMSHICWVMRYFEWRDRNIFYFFLQSWNRKWSSIQKISNFYRITTNYHA